MSALECIAIDDEPIALEIISNFCVRYGNITLNSFTDPIQGLEAIEKTHPQLVFLDIHMSGLNGLNLAKQLPKDVKFIFTTAYAQHALEGFNLNAIDFLYKPFSYARFAQAVDKAAHLIRLEQNAVERPSTIVVKQEYMNVTIPIDEIVYVEAMENYSKINTQAGKLVITRSPLKKILDMLPQNKFLRAHRSFVINIDKISSFNRSGATMCNGKNIHFGKQYAEYIYQAITSQKTSDQEKENEQ